MKSNVKTRKHSKTRENTGNTRKHKNTRKRELPQAPKKPRAFSAYAALRRASRSRARLAPGGARRGTGRRATAARQHFSRSLQCAQSCSGAGDLSGSGMAAHSEPGAASLAAGRGVMQPRPLGRARQAQQQGHLLRHLLAGPLFRVHATPKRTETDPARLAAPGCSRLARRPWPQQPPSG